MIKVIVVIIMLLGARVGVWKNEKVRINYR